MYTTTGEKLTWAEFNRRHAAGEEIFIGDYPREDKDAFLRYAHSHTVKETEQWLIDNEANEDIMYNEVGRPDAYDRFDCECAGVRCLDGWIWN